MQVVFERKNLIVYKIENQLLVIDSTNECYKNPELVEFLNSWIKTNHFTGEVINMIGRVSEMYEEGKYIRAKNI